MVSAGLPWVTGALGADEPLDDPTDPKNSVTDLPLRALATAVSNPAETVRPAA